MSSNEKVALARLLHPQTNTDPIGAKAVLHFWFEDCRPWQWFRQRDAFDALIRERFGVLVASALAGQLVSWEQESDQALALVLLLDQFTRQVYRGKPQAYRGDAHALALSQRALANSWIEAEPQRVRRQFWLMPMLHSENAAVVEQAIPLLERFADSGTADVGRANLMELQRHGHYRRRRQR